MYEKTFGTIAGEIKGVKNSAQNDKSRINWLENRFAGIKSELNAKLKNLENRVLLGDIQLIRPGQAPENPAVPATIGNFSYVRWEYFAQSLDGDNTNNSFDTYIAQTPLVKPTTTQRGQDILSTNWWIPQIELDTNNKFKQLRVRSTESIADPPIYFTRLDRIRASGSIPESVKLIAGETTGNNRIEFTIPVRNSVTQNPWFIPQVQRVTGANPGLNIYTGSRTVPTYIRTPSTGYLMAEAQSATDSNVRVKFGNTAITLANINNIPDIPEQEDFEIPVEVAHARKVTDGIRFLWGDNLGRTFDETVYLPTNTYTMATAQTRNPGARVYLRYQTGTNAGGSPTYTTVQMAKFSDIPTSNTGNLTGRWNDTDNAYPSPFYITLPNRTGSATRNLPGNVQYSGDQLLTGRFGNRGSGPNHMYMYSGSTYASVQPVPSQVGSSASSGNFDRVFMRVFTVNASSVRTGYQLWYFDSPPDSSWHTFFAKRDSNNNIQFRLGNDSGTINIGRLSNNISWD